MPILRLEVPAMCFPRVADCVPMHVARACASVPTVRCGKICTP
jgi:hypothetical protein